MHILVIGINYAPEIIGIGENTTQLCEYLVSLGHRVKVITAFPHYPEWKVRPAYRGRIFMRETINGVSVYRGYSLIPRVSTRALQRILHDTTSATSALIIGLFLPRPDMVLSISPPLQGGAAGYFLAKLKRSPFILQVKDLVPDLAISLGILKDNMWLKIGKKLEMFVYSKAAGILVICQGFVNNLKAKGVPERKIHLLPNWVDLNHIKPLNRNNNFRKTNMLQNKFVALYSGNMSAKQKLINVVSAARHLLGYEDILFLLAGDGPQKKDLQREASSEENIRFMPLQPVETFPLMLAAANLLILNQNSGVIDMVIPYKTLVYMSTGLPIVASVHTDSETARYIRIADCGIVVPPERPRELAEAVLALHNDEKMSTRLGRNGRKYAEGNFDRESILTDYNKYFIQIAGLKDQPIKK
ncbi:MAG: WcaI family glycosyltransferase [Thermodesulfobacteriota bacterium]|nr:WcaI family glycosyltransferase [Thermodesulfobacteriota bacterium]